MLRSRTPNTSHVITFTRYTVKQLKQAQQKLGLAGAIHGYAEYTHKVNRLQSELEHTPGSSASLWCQVALVVS